jgi:hypothetical protein
MTETTSMPGTMMPDRRERWLPLVLAVMAAAWVVVSIEPFPVGVFQDDGIYYVLAKSLATGEGYRYLHMPDAPVAVHYPPLYPLVLAGFWKLSPEFPANVTLFKFVNAAFTAMIALGAWRFARREAGLGPWSALLSVGAFVVCTPIVLLSVMVLSEPMFLAALFPVLMASERAGRTGTNRDAVIAGVAGGLLSLIRTLGAVAIPATALVLLWRRRWIPAALVCVSGFLVMLPWQMWVAAHGDAVPHVFLGKYGSYSGWVVEAIRDGGPLWVAKVAYFNLQQIVTQGWATVAVNTLPAWIKWPATGALIPLFACGWWRLLQRAPVTAWAVAGYLVLVVAWPFLPARFIFGIWPLVGIMFGLAIEPIVRWTPKTSAPAVMRWAAVGAVVLLAAGYVRYNYLGTSRRWWSQVQMLSAGRAKHLAEWVMANTPADAVIATDDDVLIHLYTGRPTVPNGTFTPQEHLVPQTPAVATAALREIMKAYNVDYVLSSSNYGAFATEGLASANPPELVKVSEVRSGAIFKPATPRASAGGTE